MGPILVIDDDQLARRLVRSALERAGYQVIDAVNGDEGLALVRTARPSLVITDILMPDKEGLETIRELRREHGSLPVIAMSGGGGSLEGGSMLEVAKLFGARAILSKPFEIRELLATVREAVGAPGEPPDSGPPAT